MLGEAVGELVGPGEVDGATVSNELVGPGEVDGATVSNELVGPGKVDGTAATELDGPGKVDSTAATELDGNVTGAELIEFAGAKLAEPVVGIVESSEVSVILLLITSIIDVLSISSFIDVLPISSIGVLSI